MTILFGHHLSYTDVEEVSSNLFRLRMAVDKFYEETDIKKNFKEVFNGDPFTWSQQTPWEANLLAGATSTESKSFDPAISPDKAIDRDMNTRWMGNKKGTLTVHF